MKIKSVHIENYRTFSNADCYLKDDVNFIIGKNNIGKTSFIDLLGTIFSRNNFSEDDFSDVSKPIKVKVTLKLDEEEIGLFDDLFSPNNDNEIDILFSQENPSTEIKAYHAQTNAYISRSRIQNINYIKYTSNRKSVRSNELTLSKKKFLLIPQLIDAYVNKNVQSSKLSVDEDLIKYVNKNLKHIRSFRDNNIKLRVSEDIPKIIKRIVTLTDSHGIEFSNLGYGIQFASLFSLELLDNIERILRYNPEEKILSLKNKKVLKLIVSIDEPELHLHPNMQKKMIRDIKNVVEGEDNEFNQLIKILFGIDTLDGQLIVVTHSPNILSADYRCICRAYQDEIGNTSFACGSQIKFPEKIIKELIAEITEFKEVMFADKIILCEGQTEQTALPIFAKRLNKDLLDQNISIMAVHGKDNLGKFITLFNKLKVKNWGIIDNDDNNKEKEEYDKFDNLLFTNKSDFEYECFSEMHLDNMVNFFVALNSYKNKDDRRMNSFWIRFLNEDEKKKLLRTQDIRILTNLTPSEKERIREESQDKFISKYMKDKSTITGKLIAENVAKVPCAYRELIDAVFNETGE